MVRYATSKSLCRNQFLLSYFGQLDTPRCGRCDVCSSMGKLNPDHPGFEQIRDRLSTLLSGGAMDIQSLVEASGMEPEQVTGVVEWMIDRGWVVRQEDLRLHWRGPSV